MPLIVMTGKPSSGKSTIAERLGQLFKTKIDSLHIIGDNNNSTFSRSIFADSEKEREHRSFLRSEVQRLLTKDKLIICDSMNYIRGFRYELYCIAKLVQTTYAVVYCNTDIETCKRLNLKKVEAERYDGECIDELSTQYEEPCAKSRWDSPLFELIICEKDMEELENGDVGLNNSPQQVTIPFDQIYSSLFRGKPLVANLSTHAGPSVSNKFVYVLDQVTQEIVSSILEKQKSASFGDILIVPNNGAPSEKIVYTRRRTVAEFSRLRRKFIAYMQTHPVEEELNKVVSLFVNFLNTNQ